MARTFRSMEKFFGVVFNLLKMGGVYTTSNSEKDLLRERPKRDDDNWEPHLVDHQMLHVKPLFHFTIQKRDNTKKI